MRVFFRVLLGILFIIAGLMHFINPDFYLAMMPPYLPWHQFLVDLSGVIEVGLGVMALTNIKPRITGISLILLLIAVFPANIYLALNPQLMPDTPPSMLLWRLPFQAVFIYWVYRSLLYKNGMNALSSSQTVHS